jgi:1-acyl-sn-glycerol-3-phosphate acyltransferase
VIANHNSGGSFETLILFVEWTRKFGPDARAVGLAHPWAFVTPGVRGFLTRIGAVPATYETAQAELRAGAAVLVFPGGNWQFARPFWKERDRDFGGRKGWARIAASAGVPVYPVAIDGSHWVNPMFGRWRWLARAMVIPWLLDVRWFPLSTAQILATVAVGWFGRDWPTPLWLAGMYFAFLSTTLALVIPAKIRLRFQPPIFPPHDVDELYRKVVAAIS